MIRGFSIVEGFILNCYLLGWLGQRHMISTIEEM